MPGRVFLENCKTMTVEDPEIIDSSSDSSAETTKSSAPGTRVEPCEFESLLRRAMEILDSRSRGVTRQSS
jgi:hypothetical protein